MERVRVSCNSADGSQFSIPNKLPNHSHFTPRTSILKLLSKWKHIW